MNGNPTTLHTLRQQRAAALVPTVRSVRGGFRVASGSRDTSYLVTQPNGRLVCSCRDFTLHQGQPDFSCKHILAVEGALQEGGLSDQENGFPAVDMAGPVSSTGVNVVHRYLPNVDPVRLKLIKNTKGYSWEIAVAERDPDTAIAVLQDLEQRVKAEFGGQQGDP